MVHTHRTLHFRGMLRNLDLVSEVLGVVFTTLGLEEGPQGKNKLHHLRTRLDSFFLFPISLVPVFDGLYCKHFGAQWNNGGI